MVAVNSFPPDSSKLGSVMVRAGQPTATDESPEALTDALLNALRPLMAISARSIAGVDIDAS
jgi:hypothetical protein